MAGLGGIVGGFGGSAIGGATVTLRLDDAQFKSALAEDEAKFKSSTTSMGASAGKGSALAGAAFNKLALGAGIAVAAGVSMAVTFDKTFAQIGSLAGKVGVPMDQAKQHVLDLAKATGQDPNGLASALYFAASAGLQASQVMPVLDASAKAAAMGMGDAQTVAQTLTSVLNAYKGTGLDTGTAMNIMTAAVKNGKAEMSDFASGLGPIISVAANAGVSFQDLAAGIAEATNQGVPFARAVTGFRFLISSLTSPTAKASTALASIGLSADSVAKMLQQPGGLEKAIQLIHDRTAQMGTAGREAWSAITGGARGAIVAIDLVGKHTADTNRIVQDMQRAATKGATDFADAWNKISNTDAVKFQQALAAVKVALVKLGTEALPAIAPIVAALAKILPVAIALAPAILAVWAAMKGAQLISAITGLTSLQLGFVAVAAAAAAFETVVGRLSADLGSQLHAAIQGGLTDIETFSKKLDDASAHLNTFNWGHLMDILVPGFQQVNDSVTNTAVAADKAAAAWTRHKAALQTTTQAANEVTRSEDLLVGRMVDGALATDKATKATHGLTAAQQRQVQATAAAGVAVANMSTVLGTNLSSLHAQVGAMGKVATAYFKWGQTVGQTFNDVNNNLTALDSNNKATFADMQKAVQTGMQSMKAFGQNIHTITSTGGADAKQFAAYLVALGPAGEHMAAVLAAQPPKVRAAFESNFAKAQTAGQTLGSTIEHAIIGGLTHVEAEVLVASGKFATLQAAIDALHGKTIDITIHYNVTGSGAPGGKPLP